MQWRHEVSPEWLEARKGCLTATDVVRMIPELKKAKKLFKVPGDITLAEIVDGMERDEILEKLDLSAFPVTLGVLADKMSTHVDNDNIVSFGSAARGHVLEADFFTRCPDVWKHWDDVLVTREFSGLPAYMKFGFSPDGFMDMEQDAFVPDGEFEIMAEALTSHALENDVKISPIEVKSYEPKHYLKAIMTPKEEMAERHQLAMIGCTIGWEYIDSITLVFYCPEFCNSDGMLTSTGERYEPLPVTSYSYTLKDLLKESKEVYDVCTLLLIVAEKTADIGLDVNKSNGWMYDSYSNQRDWSSLDEIWNDWQGNGSRMFGGTNVQ